MMGNIFSTLHPLSGSHNIANLSLLYRYFQGKFSNDLHSFVSRVQVLYYFKGINFISVFQSNSLFSADILAQTPVDSFSVTDIYITCSCQMQIFIYHSNLQNLRFLPPPLSFLLHIITISTATLYLAQLLSLISSEL